MKREQAVSARVVLKAIQVSKRRGNRIIEEMEEREPALAEYLMEELSLIHSRLWKLCEEPRPTARLQSQITQMACVLVEAIRRSGEPSRPSTRASGKPPSKRSRHA